MAAGSLDSEINPWGAEMFRTMKAADPQTAAEQSAYDRWMDQNADRQQARVDRIHGAEGIIPLPLWLAMFMISVVIFVYLLFFADSGERAKTQALLMGSVTIVICLLLQLLVFFNHPHGHGVGRLHPTAMERTLRIMDAQFEVADVNLEVPCDEPRSPELSTEPGHGSASSSCSSPCCWSWARSRPRGAATRPPAGTASRPRRPAAPVPSGSARHGRPAWPRPRPRSTWPPSSRGPTRRVAAKLTCRPFYVERFRPEFKPAFDAWLATDPFVDSSAPPTPFAMPEYRVAAGEEAARLDKEAEASAATVATNIQRSSNYVLSVVLYTIVLLFAGMAGEIEQPSAAHRRGHRGLRRADRGASPGWSRSPSVSPSDRSPGTDEAPAETAIVGTRPEESRHGERFRAALGQRWPTIAGSLLAIFLTIEGIAALVWMGSREARTGCRAAGLPGRR